MTNGKRGMRVILAAAIALTLASAAIALAAEPGPLPPETEGPPALPDERMTVVPEGGAPSAAAPKKHVTHHKTTASAEVEPIKSRLAIKQDAWIYSSPTKWSKHLKRAHTGNFVNVTGTTHYYLQVKLASGETGYISPADVNLVKPADKVFQLTHDAPVTDVSNHWGKKLAEVHARHPVHVIGV